MPAGSTFLDSSVDVWHCYYVYGQDNENSQCRSHWMFDSNRLACSEARECECCKMLSMASNIGPEYEAGSLITSAKIAIYRSS